MRESRVSFGSSRTYVNDSHLMLENFTSLNQEMASAGFG
jgi:hypothetical protein